MPSDEHPEKGRDEIYCNGCGELVKRDVTYCPHCGDSPTDSTESASEESFGSPHTQKSPGVAAILSFIIVGLGQIYNGQIVRGIAFHIGMWFIGVFAILFFWLFFPLLIAFGFWAFNVYDAYDQAQKINLGQD